MTKEAIIKDPAAFYLFQAGWDALLNKLQNDDLLDKEVYYTTGSVFDDFENFKSRILSNKCQIMSFQIMEDGKPTTKFYKLYETDIYSYQNNIIGIDELFKNSETFRIFCVKRLTDDKTFTVGDTTPLGIIAKIELDTAFLSKIKIVCGNTIADIIIADINLNTKQPQ